MHHMPYHVVVCHGDVDFAPWIAGMGGLGEHQYLGITAVLVACTSLILPAGPTWASNQVHCCDTTLLLAFHQASLEISTALPIWTTLWLAVKDSTRKRKEVTKTLNCNQNLISELRATYTEKGQSAHCITCHCCMLAGGPINDQRWERDLDVCQCKAWQQVKERSGHGKPDQAREDF